MSTAPKAQEDDNFMTPEWMEQRGQDFAAINSNALMKNAAALNHDELDELLDGSRIRGSADHFVGFSILFGFDRHGRDFVVVKSSAEGGLHFVLIAE